MYYAIIKRTVIGPHIATGMWAVILSLLPVWYWRGQSHKTPSRRRQWKSLFFSSEHGGIHPPKPWRTPPLCKTKEKTWTLASGSYKVTFFGYLNKDPYHEQQSSFAWTEHWAHSGTKELTPVIVEIHQGYWHWIQVDAINRSIKGSWQNHFFFVFTWLSIPSISNIEKNRIAHSGETGSCVTACG